MKYNYVHVDAYVADGAEAADFGAFPDRLRVGESAPDVALTDLDSGRPERLSGRWPPTSAGVGRPYG